MMRRVVMVGLALLSGCDWQPFGGGSDHGPAQGPTDDGVVVGPGPRSGGLPGADAGGAEPPAMAGDGDGPGAAAPLPPNFVLDCDGRGPVALVGDPRQAWERARDARGGMGAMGQVASIDLRGDRYRLTGAGTAGVIAAPLSIRVHGPTQGLIGLSDAGIAGLDGTGRVELYAGGAGGSEIGLANATAGSLTGITLGEVLVEEGTVTAAIATRHERVGNTDREHVDASVTALSIEGVRAVYLYPEGRAPEDPRIEVTPDGPVVVRHASSMTFYDGQGASVSTPMAEPMELVYGELGLAGDFTGGSVMLDGEPMPTSPIALFGTGATLRAGATAVASTAPFRVTQAVNRAGLVIPAQVELSTTDPEVWVEPSGARVIRVHYRERSFEGDAVLREIRVDGAGEDLLELRTGLMPTLTGQLIEAVIDTGWAAPLAGLASIPALPFVFVIDVFAGILGGCADQPEALEPFPQWMSAGDIGTMEVRIKGDLPPGTYSTSLTFVGHNFCPVALPLTIHIGAPPPDDDAGI